MGYNNFRVVNMMEFLGNVNEWVVNIVESMGPYGVLFSCFLIIVESMVPILPLTVFIAINFLYYGPVVGFIISWIFTIIGCSLSFFLCKKGLRGFVNRKIRKYPKIDKWLKKVDDFKLSSLVVLIAMPFTPAFMVNIAAGISKMSYKKFLTAIIIGKIFLVYFWGYVGVSLIESLKNPIVLVKVGIMLLIAYLISSIVNKKLKLE